jgi:hypothetical protein
MFELFEVDKISSVMAATKNNVATRRISAECSKHLCEAMVSNANSLEDQGVYP